jgi:hypothetical protein
MLLGDSDGDRIADLAAVATTGTAKARSPV